MALKRKKLVNTDITETQSSEFSDMNNNSEPILHVQ